MEERAGRLESDVVAEIRSDIRVQRIEMRDDIVGLRSELNAEISRVRNEVATVRNELRTEMKDARNETRSETEEIRERISSAMLRATLFLCFAVTGALIGVLARGFHWVG